MTNPEILGPKDSAPLNKTTDTTDDALINRIGREGKMVALGVGGSVTDLAQHPLERLPEVGSSVMLGGSIGMLAESGRLGAYTAGAIGLAMLGKLAYDEVTGGRWSKFGQAWSDTWNSGANMDKNIELTKNSLGNFVVDMGVGYAGFELGASAVRSRWGKSLTDSRANSFDLGGKMTGELGLVPAVAESGMRLDGLGRRISADVKAGGGGGESGLLDSVNKALEKRQPATSLAEIKDTMLYQLIDKDAEVLGYKGQLKDMLKERQGLGAKDQALNADIATHTAELTNLNMLKGEDLAVRVADPKAMSPEMRAVRAAEDAVENLKRQKSEVLPQKEGELRQLDQQIQAQDKAKSEQKSEGKPKGKGKGEGEAEGEVSPTQALKDQRGELKDQIRELKESTSDPAFQRARARVADAQETWRTAKDAAQGRIDQLIGTPDNPGILTAKQNELASHQTQLTTLAQQMQATLELLNKRSDDIKANSDLARPVAEEKPVTPAKQPKRADQVASDGPAERPAAPVKEVKEPAKVEAAATPEVQSRSQAQAALTEAQDMVRPYQLNRELKQAVAAKTDITSGKLDSTFKDPQAKERALEQAEVRIASTRTQLSDAGPQKYAQTVKGLKGYVDAVEDYLAKEPDGAKRDAFVKQAVVDLESMMPSVDNLYKGIPGKMADLRRINVDRPFDAYKRLGDISEHLDKRIQDIDGNQDKRISRVMDNPIVQAVLEHKGELPKDGAIFFIKDGTIVEATAGNGARYPQMIDVNRLMKGVDKDGAGLYRFIGHEDIDGAAIIEPVLDRSGKPKVLEVKNGVPRYAKQVWGTIGDAADIPATLQPGLSFGNAIKNFGSEGQLKQANTVVNGLIDKAAQRPAESQVTFFRHGRPLELEQTLADLTTNARAKDNLINRKVGGAVITDASGTITDIVGSVPQGLKVKASLAEFLDQFKKPEEQ